MKEKNFLEKYENLIGKIILSIAVILAACILANAISALASEIHSGLFP